MSARVRGVLVGLALALAPLLLLDLAGQLQAAAAGDPGASTAWWALGAYALVGAVVALGVAAGRKERLAPAVAAGVVAVLLLPALPGIGQALVRLPVVSEVVRGMTGTVLVVLGAYLYAAVRGPRA